ncbi:MAG: RDD family protein [Gemmataceae bacterium]|nr:RDD family protein [Gemmataceae bacterium]
MPPNDEVVSTFGTTVPRYGAAWTDSIFAIIAAIALGKAISETQPYAQAVALVGAYFGYYFVFEGAFSRTPGKFIAGLAIAQIDGTRCTFRQSAIRNCFRVLEVNPLLFGCLPAAISMYYSAKRQRIGDRVAGTLVIHSRNLKRRHD